VIDIGGGSTEFITGAKNNIEQRKSLQIGAVRLHERFFTTLPPSKEAITEARNEIRSQLQMLQYGKQQGEIGEREKRNVEDKNSVGEVVGVGGTFTTLAAIDLGLTEFQSERVHNHNMSVEAVSKMTSYLLTTPLESLLQNPAIHPKRADILPAGALILEESLQYLGVSSCKTSTKGLRYGVLYETPIAG
jgi:exopolyphosphatase / guanosine-5'-triphosphate,3'-diphosphate pyrophosphatase